MPDLVSLLWWGAACAGVAIVLLAWGCAAMAGSLDDVVSAEHHPFT